MNKKYKTYKELETYYNEITLKGDPRFILSAIIDNPILLNSYKGDPRIKGLTCAKATFIFANKQVPSDVLDCMIDEWFLEFRFNLLEKLI